MYEVGGGAGLEFFAAQGAHTSFNGDFRLVGDVDGGGLAMTGFGDAVHTNIASQMQGVNTTVWTRYAFAVSDPAQYESSHLNVKYNDGFVAYLNGVEICRRNAPGTLAWNFSSLLGRLLGVFLGRRGDQPRPLHVSAPIGHERTGHPGAERLGGGLELSLASVPDRRYARQRRPVSLLCDADAGRTQFRHGLRRIRGGAAIQRRARVLQFVVRAGDHHKRRQAPRSTTRWTAPSRP